MKLQCSGCDAEEARVFCCADEAALCYCCDEKVHAANKLMSKHQRVPLSTSSSSPLPKCDICQETFGYFLCLEDRALLCRKCDVAIHSINSFVSNHQRFLLTGVKVGLESSQLRKATDKDAAHCLVSSSTAKDSIDYLPQLPTYSKDANVVESWSNGASETAVASGNAGTNASNAESQIKDTLDLIGSNQHNPSGHDRFKAEGNGPGNSEWWKILRSTEEQLLNDEWATPDDASWTVPQLLTLYSQPESHSLVDTSRSSSKNVLSISDAGCPSGSGTQSQKNSQSAKHRSRLKRKT
ncbi:hypothetical protein ACH5RR_028394 [Cinchona calisaya]|uniref:B box-type domain-containing protein n=1 Tax=Cinchona calisaya TaxID=153742 RepID=A0ABD2YNN9_9GENT